MERKLGIIIEDKDIESALQTIEIISEQGFNAFFTMPISKEYCLKLKERADQLGLDYEFMHATWRGVNQLWTERKVPQILIDLKAQIDICAQVNVNKIIVHLSSGENAPFVNDLGFSRLDEIVEYAKSKNVLVVFENQRKLFNLACALERYKDQVGFCYDSGHEKCFTQNIKFLDFWADKVTCVHLHDNCGEYDCDQHKLPFEGAVDFNYVMDRLNKAQYKGSIMLEVMKSIYPDLTKKEFYKKAFDVAEKLSKM